MTRPRIPARVRALERLCHQSAPVTWVPLSPATVTPDLLGLTKNAPHPNAGLLFVEFMTSKEGQQICQKAAYLPARPDVPPTVPGS